MLKITCGERRQGEGEDMSEYVEKVCQNGGLVRKYCERECECM